MPKFIALLTLSFFLFGPTLPREANAEVKVGTVDMSRIFQDYHKTKEAESRMNESRLAAKKEMDERFEARNKILEEINALNRDMEKRELSAAAREEKGKQRDDRIAEARNLEREINEFKTTRERHLQELAARMRNSLIEDIMRVVNERVKTGGYDLLFDRSGHSLSSVPIVLFSKESFDFTAEIVAALNRSRPVAPKEEARPAATPKK